MSSYEEAIGFQDKTKEVQSRSQEVPPKSQEVQPAPQEGMETERQVWDLPVRIFHWSLVLAVAAAFVTNKLGVRYFKYHVWAGYTVIVLVAFRLVWGLVGTRHARFWNFLRGPSETLTYARDLVAGKDRHYPGHNPLGALMVILLLGALAVQSIIGLFGNDEIFNFGPLYGYVTKEFSLALTSIHKKLFYWLAGAVALHVLAVAAHKIFLHENLVRAMFTGRKPVDAVPAEEAIHASRTWLAALLGVAIAIALAYIVTHAPAATDTGDY
ncbi:cytochrome b/b6 domain-containing protein [uncultured Rhodoblastus sp.]|uniref:cytochrome b/b6 domain-containing protein n=1 Tax=uncultured Rhodoblastus sp. TaxID=543037 RepID=UPI0025DB2F66|nr:cytochrome b/b6 domain-containing protein [uncultured Rhodoblastus sp.]